ncbi:DUF2382 domain-containing protein [uncultured Amnibacterium sp.]|uniref:DUF2382 domain-containing protein n=1 Tax=uncultured Amnibacterium sp. TaxID=1631851 RepID=UPI0035CB49E7
MIATPDIDEIIGADVVDAENNKVGKVGQVYLDSEDNHPSWVSVKTGLFGTSETLVPIGDATWDQSALHVSYAKDRIKDAPRVDPDQDLSPEEQDRLYSYYEQGGAYTDSVGTTATAGDYSDSSTSDYTGTEGATSVQGVQIDDGASRGSTEVQDATVVSDTAGGHDTSGPNTDDAITRSEERLNVGTQSVQTGRARLRKYIVTEQQSVTVPVTHEEVRVEREPITDANAADAYRGADLSEEQAEVTLNEERVVVDKETVPVERVRLEKDVVTENQNVTEDVRKEQIDYEDGTPGTRA